MKKSYKVPFYTGRKSFCVLITPHRTIDITHGEYKKFSDSRKALSSFVMGVFPELKHQEPDLDFCLQVIEVKEENGLD